MTKKTAAKLSMALQKKARNKLPKALALSALLITSAACGRVLAEQILAPQTTEPEQHFVKTVFHTLDCENIGQMQASEIDEHFNQLFLPYDRDRSRSLSEQEFISGKTGNKQLEAVIFKRMDSDHNKTVSVKEYREYVFYAAQLIDTDHDGEVSLSEAGLTKTPVHKKPKPKLENKEQAEGHAHE